MKIVGKAKIQLKNMLGSFFIFLQPKYAASLLEKGISLSLHLPLKDRLIRDVLLSKYKNSKDFETLSKIHKQYWSGQGKEYFSSKYNENTLEHFFIPECSFLFDILEEKLKTEPQEYNKLVEIGTGDGTVLDYLSSRFPRIDKFIGIDLSVNQIDANKQRFITNNKLEFVWGDAEEWVKKNVHKNTIIITSRGVLEYFTQSRLEELFGKLVTIGNIIFIAIEPTDVKHDFNVNPNSQIYGFEGSFSHNYAQLFESSGFSIWHQSKKLSTPEIYFNFFGAIAN